MSNANKFKNRIINALPCEYMCTSVILIVINYDILDDYNRVKLSVTPGVPGSDYINASYIDVRTYMY